MENNLNIFILDCEKINQVKQILTPGPAALTLESVSGLRSGFGRGDSELETIRDYVEENLKRLTGKKSIISIQGSASLAVEIGLMNFVGGKILIVDTGFYSMRMSQMIGHSSKFKDITILKYDNLESVDQAQFDWIVFCYVETGIGRKYDIKKIKELAINTNAKIFMDSTASIGLEDHHELADVCAFSSCKGLLGITGASFLTYNDKPENNVKSFYMRVDTHENRLMTGPYHQFYSLGNTILNYSKLKSRVIKSKNDFMFKYTQRLVLPHEQQPLIATQVKGRLVSKTPENVKVVTYTPREIKSGFAIVSHLGDVHHDVVGQIKYSHEYIDVVEDV